MVVPIVIALCVFAYAYASNRSEVSRNAEILGNQRQALAYLCETVRVIDAIYVQTAALDQLFMKDRTLSTSVRQLIRERLRVLNTAHRELSNTRACVQIE